MGTWRVTHRTGDGKMEVVDIAAGEMHTECAAASGEVTWVAFVNRVVTRASMTTDVLWELSGEEFVSAEQLD